MKYPKGFVGVTALPFLAACISPVEVVVDGHGDIRGSGYLATESRVVRGFDGIVVSGAGRVIVEQTGRESLWITTDDNILPYVVSEARNGLLILGAVANRSLSPSSGIEYRLEVRRFHEIQIFGAVEVEAVGIDTETLVVGMSGDTHVNVSGLADWQDVATSGSSRSWAPDLWSEEALVRSSGASSVVVNVRDRLTVEASGVALIEYIGYPVVIRRVSGGAVVKRY